MTVAERPYAPSQAIALWARLLGMPATIVMPHDAPAAKVAATRDYGAASSSTTAMPKTGKGLDGNSFGETG